MSFFGSYYKDNTYSIDLSSKKYDLSHLKHVTCDLVLDKIRRKKFKTNVLNDLNHIFLNSNQQNMYYPCNQT